jgi:hypothetical protein
MKHFIYALVDPRDFQVKYVGQCLNMKKRLQVHVAPSSLTRPNPKTNWLSGLLPEKPWMVLLETVECHSSSHDSDCAGTVVETKWIKRFRRTILNKALRENSPQTWDSLVNVDGGQRKPPMPLRLPAMESEGS